MINGLTSEVVSYAKSLFIVCNVSSSIGVITGSSSSSSAIVVVIMPICKVIESFLMGEVTEFLLEGTKDEVEDFLESADNLLEYSLDCFVEWSTIFRQGQMHFSHGVRASLERTMKNKNMKNPWKELKRTKNNLTMKAASTLSPVPTRVSKERIHVSPRRTLTPDSEHTSLHTSPGGIASLFCTFDKLKLLNFLCL